MPIANSKPRTKRITFGDGEDEYFDVRGLGVWDAGQILEIHREPVEKIVEEARARGGLNMQDEAVAVFLMDMLRETPFLVASIIAYAADEPTQAMAVVKMILPVQVEALKAIGELTFKDLASAKKFIADVMTMVQGFLPPEPEALALAAE